MRVRSLSEADCLKDLAGMLSEWKLPWDNAAYKGGLVMRQLMVEAGPEKKLSRFEFFCGEEKRWLFAKWTKGM